MKKKDIVYELECWVEKNGDEIIIHHTNNGGFPAPGQFKNEWNAHPAKLTVYKSINDYINEKVL